MLLLLLSQSMNDTNFSRNLFVCLQNVAMETLWAKRPVVITFLRRFGWPFCRLGAKELSTLKPRLDANNIGLVGVGLEELGVEEFVKGEFFKGGMAKSISVAPFGDKVDSDLLIKASVNPFPVDPEFVLSSKLCRSRPGDFLRSCQIMITLFAVHFVILKAISALKEYSSSKWYYLHDRVFFYIHSFNFHVLKLQVITSAVVSVNRIWNSKSWMYILSVPAQLAYILTILDAILEKFIPIIRYYSVVPLWVWASLRTHVK